MNRRNYSRTLWRLSLTVFTIIGIWLAWGKGFLWGLGAAVVGLVIGFIFNSIVSAVLGSRSKDSNVLGEQGLLDLAASIKAGGGNVVTFGAGGLQELSGKDIERQQKARKWEEIGDAHFQKDEFRQALEAYNKALEIHPDEILYMNIGSVYGSMGNFDLAIEYYEKSLKINPNYDRARKNLEEVKTLRGR